MKPGSYNHFQPNSKAKNKVWNSSEGDRPVIAHHCKTSNPMLYAIYYSLFRKVQSFKFQSQKVVLSLRKFYRESVLTQFIDFYEKHRPRTGVHAIKLLHDNAQAHKSATVQEYLKESVVLFTKILMIKMNILKHCNTYTILHLCIP
jgi:hypothetical protein